ncbi:hypothetical protein [Streptomyces viridosporus]|uniref:hypothetical protein n=1 Tax=Streptomyces viridosporus TaxID=67581 RepID=UPI001C3F9774
MAWARLGIRLGIGAARSRTLASVIRAERNDHSRYVVEQTFALLHQSKRLAVRCERRTELHDAFVFLACSLICWRRLKKTRS